MRIHGCSSLLPLPAASDSRISFSQPWMSQSQSQYAPTSSSSSRDSLGRLLVDDIQEVADQDECAGLDADFAQKTPSAVPASSTPIRSDGSERSPIKVSNLSVDIYICRPPHVLTQRRAPAAKAVGLLIRSLSRIDYTFSFGGRRTTRPESATLGAAHPLIRPFIYS
jgi:hypothetical protein